MVKLAPEYVGMRTLLPGDKDCVEDDHPLQALHDVVGSPGGKVCIEDDHPLPASRGSDIITFINPLQIFFQVFCQTSTFLEPNFQTVLPKLILMKMQLSNLQGTSDFFRLIPFVSKIQGPVPRLPLFSNYDLKRMSPALLYFLI